MECPRKWHPSSSENDFTVTLTSEITSLQDSQTPADHGAKTASKQGTQTPVQYGAQADATTSTQAAAETPLENLLAGKEMSRSQDEPPCELENQFILRLPLEHASTVRKMIRSGSSAMKDKLKIDLFSVGCHAAVEVDGVSLAAKLVDLPCVIGSLKTLDKKTFYKTADVSQMLVCTADGGIHSSPEEQVTSTDLKAIRKSEKERQKKYIWKHGITPPLENVRERRFRKTTKKVAEFKQVEEMSVPEYVESPDVEKEVKRLLCSDAEAVSVRWEVIGEDETKEIESQGSIPGFEIASGMSGYKQGHTSPENVVFREMFSDSSSDEDEDDEEDEDEEEEEDYYEEDMERELQVKFIESGQYEAKEGASSIVTEIQKHTHYVEKKLQEIRCKAQRQKVLLMKVENLMLKNHLRSVLEHLKLEEKQKNEQLICLQEKLNYFLKK
ncbi:transcription initiation factor TFIID subunit 7-like [Hippopotamus amphibius kiboko]|uniref:transcription initiation factor TFIID subunit 7-like n=1 Tax=Hippopotamus amphibius kiboko TaxID=575201 RepID=UPI002597927F|nr:transcription initiation factor TFIID subunit 7-like [Hippopotamus amphibius kiboko]